jgi:hypothetical protein
MIIEVTAPDKTIVLVEVIKYTRGGTKSDTLEIWIYNGKQLTPFARRHYGWTMTLNQLFKYTYSEKIQNIIPHMKNAFLSLIPKDDTKGLPYHIPVILEIGKHF